MEIWDLYDENRRLTGETMIRGNRVPEGRYHLVVDALFLNSRGETLLQRRAHDKPVMPDIWSVTGGSALRGEDSAAAIRRETREEMGFTPDLENGKVLLSDRMTGETGGYFRDVWLFFQSVPLEEMRFQPEEVQDGQWILPEKIAADETLSAQLGQLRFWKRAFPFLLLESLRIRVPRGLYRHYKGNLYRVEGLALHSETLEPMVMYRALYGSGEAWVRPAWMWLEEVTLPDGKRVRRFEQEKP